MTTETKYIAVQVPQHGIVMRGELTMTVGFLGAPGTSNEMRLPYVVLDHPPALAVPDWLPAFVKAVDDLCFECDGITRTDAPSRETYNTAFAAIKAAKERLAASPSGAQEAKAAFDTQGFEWPTAADEQIAAWVQRHGVENGVANGNTRECFEDAQTLLAPMIAAPAPLTEGAAEQAVKELLFSGRVVDTLLIRDICRAVRAAPTADANGEKK